MSKSSKNETACQLKLKPVAIDTYRENVAYLHRNCPVYRAEGFQALSKIEISSNGKKILAVLNVVDDTTIVNTNELGLSEQAFSQFDCAIGTHIHVNHASPPQSMDAVRAKIAGERLTLKDFQNITQDIVNNRYSKMEMAAFLVASDQSGLDRDEVLFLTRAMTDTGRRLNWHETVVVDKHCIGGVPGNRTSMLVVPILAAHGMLMPKTSSRAITSPAGTADTMEILAEVDLSPDTMHRIVRKQRGCIAWGGTANLAPVDDILISVERPLGIDSQSQMVASILSKKIAAGSTHLLIDIPIGPAAKVKQMRQAMRLRKLFEFVADQMGIHLEVVVTDGSQPIGQGIGPVLEARDVLRVLENHPDAPQDLRQKSLHLAGRILEFDPDIRGGQGYAIARDILESGRAFEKMQAIIDAQGKQTRRYMPGSLVYEVTAPTPGTITAINNYLLSRIARMAGAPMDKGAGVDLLKKIGDSVDTGDILYRVHAEFQADFQFARHLSQEEGSGYTIGDEPQIRTLQLEF